MRHFSDAISELPLFENVTCVTIFLVILRFMIEIKEKSLKFT